MRIGRISTLFGIGFKPMLRNTTSIPTRPSSEEDLVGRYAAGLWLTVQKKKSMASTCTMPSLTGLGKWVLTYGWSMLPLIVHPHT